MGGSKPPTRANSEASTTAGTQASTNVTNARPAKPLGSSHKHRGNHLDEDRNEIEDFDLGTFYNFAEWYGDDPYMLMCLQLFEKAPPNTALRTPEMREVITRKYKDVVIEVDETLMDARDKCVSNNVIFNLPTADANGNFTWTVVTYRLPCDRTPQSKNDRASLLKYMDTDNSGLMTLDDIKVGFARIVKMPGLDDPEEMLDEVTGLAHRALQDLMLDGAPRPENDVNSKEFRVFLAILQGYLDLWEIFFEVDDSGDAMVMMEEFVLAAPKLADWGMKDPALRTDPESIFASIDRDGSGYVTFGEFADFCVRKGLLEDVRADNTSGGASPAGKAKASPKK